MNCAWEVRLAPYLHSESGVAPGISNGGLTLPTRGLKYGFQGTINVKNHLPTVGLACSDGGL